MEVSFFSNDSANQNAGTTKMLPPSGKERQSSNENAELKSHHNCRKCRNKGHDLTQKTQTNKMVEARHNASKHYLFK